MVIGVVTAGIAGMTVAEAEERMSLRVVVHLERKAAVLVMR